MHRFLSSTRIGLFCLGQISIGFLAVVFAGLAFAQEAPKPGKSDQVSQRVEPPNPLFRDFMGINRHTVNFRPKLYRPVARLVRDYHSITWDLGDDTDHPLTFPMARNGVNWDRVYGSWQDEGFEIDACLKFSELPQDQWKDMESDAKQYGRAFASSFGPSSEQGLVRTVEIGNEPGKYSDENYLRIFKNMAGGIRQADPELKIATFNVYADSKGDYHKSAEIFRGSEDLFDILKIHSYAMISSWPKWERSFPEDNRYFGFIKDIDRLIAWRDQNMPNKEVWLTEFGYDSSTKKPTKDDEFAKWQGNTDTEQAQWLVRSFFLFATRDLQRAYIFFFNDDDVPKLHNASGLTRNYQPKPSYYAVSHLYKTLCDYRFSKVVQQENERSCVYEFVHGEEPQNVIWVAWSPTGSEREAVIEVAADGKRVLRAERMPLNDEEPERVEIIGAETLKIPITESPVYLWMQSRSVSSNVD